MADDDTETPAEGDSVDDGAQEATEEQAPAVDMAYGVAVTESRGARVLHPSADELIATVEALKADGFMQLLDVIGVDYLTHGNRSDLPVTISPQRFEVVYLFRAHVKHEMIRVRVQVDANEPVVPTLFDLFPGAETPERETFDMFGITFDGHPDLCRILMPEDWDGYPLRKDYGIGRIPVQFKGAPTRR